jgi:hypothetical protein
LRRFLRPIEGFNFSAYEFCNAHERPHANPPSSTATSINIEVVGLMLLDGPPFKAVRVTPEGVARFALAMYQTVAPAMQAALTYSGPYWTATGVLVTNA